MGLTRAAPPGYIHAASGYDDELARLCLLQERYDERTFARLSALGPLAGAVCLEVGAGAGSVARWLADRAGPRGLVVATDADPRFLADIASLGVEVRRHDILADPLEPGRYDLVHCRALLCHLPDPGLALDRIAAAAGRAFDPFFGRRLPGLAASAGLADIGHEAIACHRQGASAAAELLARSLERTRRQAMPGSVAGPREFGAVLAALRDPSFPFVDALSVAVWGHRPGPALATADLG